MMDIVDNALILIIHALCFYAGMKISDRYHREASVHEEYSLRLQNARIKSGDYSAYVAPPTPVKKRRMHFGAPFEDRLKETGRATQMVTKDTPIS